MSCAKPLILLLRANPPEPGPLGEAGIVAALPLVDIEVNSEAVHEAAKLLKTCGWLAVTSPRTPRLARELRSLVDLNSARIAAVGPVTAKAVEEYWGVKPVLIPGEYCGAALAKAILKYKPRCIVLLRSERGVEDLPRILREQGVEIVEVKLYRIVELEEMARTAASLAYKFNYIVVTSPTIARLFAKFYKAESPLQVIVAIGPTTGEELRRLGFRNVIWPQEYTLKGIARLIAADWSAKRACR